MALYVAPRALATVLPMPKEAGIRKNIETRMKRMETVAFSLSLAILMTASKFRGRGGVRGFIGGTLKRLMEM